MPDHKPRGSSCSDEHGPMEAEAPVVGTEEADAKPMASHGDEALVLEQNERAGAENSAHVDGLRTEPSKCADPSEASSALECKEAGNDAFGRGELHTALVSYKRGLELLGDQASNTDDLGGVLWANVAQVHIERREWWDAALACQKAGAGMLGKRSARFLKARLRYGVATSELGLLEFASDLFRSVVDSASEGSVLAKSAGDRAEQVAARVAALAEGSGLAAEVERLREGLGPELAHPICDALEGDCATAKGRETLLAKGWLVSGDEGVGDDASGKEATGDSAATEVRRWLRACRRSLLHEMKEELLWKPIVGGRGEEARVHGEVGPSVVIL